MIIVGNKMDEPNKKTLIVQILTKYAINEPEYVYQTGIIDAALTANMDLNRIKADPMYIDVNNVISSDSLQDLRTNYPYTISILLDGKLYFYFFDTSLNYAGMIERFREDVIKAIMQYQQATGTYLPQSSTLPQTPPSTIRAVGQGEQHRIITWMKDNAIPVLIIALIISILWSTTFRRG